MAAKKNVLGLFHFSFNPKKPLGDLSKVPGLAVKIAGAAAGVGTVVSAVGAGVEAATGAVADAKAKGAGTGKQIEAGATGAVQGVADSVYPWAKYWTIAAGALILFWLSRKGR